MPVLFIITGSNGAGKSTIGYTYLPEDIQKKYTVFDGDKLALLKKRALSKSTKSFKEAGRLADEWMYKQFADQIKTAINNGDHCIRGSFQGCSHVECSQKV